MSTLYYGDEVRRLSGIEELESSPEINPQELTLATQLIEAITQPFQPGDFQDNYRQGLLKVIQAKAEGKEWVEPPEVETAKVVNLMEALKTSLERVDAPKTGGADASSQSLEPTGTESGG